jgi:E3 SUMO-protein ligase NSE2
VEKYAHIAEYQDFKRRVWDVQHPDMDIGAPETWFGDDAQEEMDDDIVLGQHIQSLNCPITLMRLEKPVKNTKCPHVYSLDAIQQLVRHGHGSCKCPVSGCQADVTMEGVKEDKVMARKLREDKAREEERAADGDREVQDITEEMSEVVYDGEEMKAE